MADQIIVVNNTPSVISVTDQPPTRLNITNEVSTVNFLLGGLQVDGIPTITGPNATVTGAVTFAGNGVRQQGTTFTFIGDYSNANVAAYLPTYTGNLSPGNITVSRDAVILGNITVSRDAVIQGNLQVLGNTTTINANTLSINDKDIIVANGAVTPSQANGAGIIVGQGNIANIIYLSTPNVWQVSPGITTESNVTANYILGNGAFLTGLPAQYSNANVANYILGNLEYGNLFASNYYWSNGVPYITSTGNVNVNINFGNSNSITFSRVGPVTSFNVVNGYINSLTANYLPTFAGNIGNGAGYIFGNGAFLTGLPAQYSNANVANYMPVYGGNILASYVTATQYTARSPGVTQSSGIVQANARLDIVSSNSVFSGAIVGNSTATFTGNVTGNYFYGNGRFLTGIAGGNGGGISNAEIAAFLATYTGSLSSGNLSVINDAVIQGNLQVLGNTTTINANTLSINDLYITVANGATTLAQANGAGLIVGDSNLANIIYNSQSQSWVVFPGIQTISVNTESIRATANITGSYIFGNGAFLTGIAPQSSYSNADVIAFLPTYTGNLVSLRGDINTTGRITAPLATFGNVSASVEINSLGNITSNGNISGNYFIGNGAFLTGISGTGNYGNANVANYLPTYTGNLVSLTGNITTQGNISANYFIGNGALLTGITGGGGSGNAGTNWDSPGNIAVGDIFAGYISNYVNAGSIYTANADINTDLQFWFAVPAPVNISWISVTYGGGVFVALAQVSSTAAISPDGITWTQRTLPVSASWFGVAYGGGVFVAVAVNSSIAATSPDGITWTQRTLPVSANWYSVAYGAGVFVAVASGSTIAATSLDGVSWTQRTLPVSAFWISVAYGAGTFVAVAQSSSIAATSPDGITWTQRALPVSASWRSVAYGAGVFVAVAQSSTTAATSTDGINWTQRTLPVSSSWISVAYGGGVFAAMSQNGYIATSPDGVSWTQRTLPVSSTGWTSVTYGGNVWIAVGSGSTFASPAETNLIYVESDERTAPPGTYRCLGGVDPIFPIYMWARKS